MAQKESEYAEKLRSLGFSKLPRELTTTHLRLAYPANFYPRKPENPSYTLLQEGDVRTIAFDDTGQGWMAASAVNLAILLGFENKTQLFVEILEREKTRGKK